MLKNAILDAKNCEDFAFFFFAKFCKKFCKTLQDFEKFLKNFKISQKVCKILGNFAKIFEICLRDDDFLVELEKC